MDSQHQALLLLEDGRAFAGVPIGARRGAVFGELIFNTSHTGYQEILTDPSYAGQLVAFTAPEIGNYGVCADDAQADRPRLSGLVIRSLSPLASSHRASADLPRWLRDHDVAGIAEVDTRALTRHLRERGAMRAGIFTYSAADPPPLEALVARVRESPSLVGRDLASAASCAAPYTIGSGEAASIALIDLGVKRAILRCLEALELRVTVLPSATTPTQILDAGYAGVVLSNGPGDPAAVAHAVATARQLVGRVPLLGICLGHQILALALGAETFKMRFGHHGGNHPVRDEQTGELWITAQNHGFAVDPRTLPDRVQRTHVSLYDQSLEGLALPEQRLMAVQFHPEGAPGPSDARGVFDRFGAMLDAQPTVAPATSRKGA